MTDNPSEMTRSAALARWATLRSFTSARVALGRAGNGVPTGAHLAFQADHAQARDAVHAALDVARMRADLTTAGFASVAVHSAASDRRTFLLRPDLGRRLLPSDRAALPEATGAMLFVICDGLSATAVQRHAVPLLARVIPALTGTGSLVPGVAPGVAPVILAEQGRVALGDEIGALMEAEAVAVLIGERPGLSSPDSLGVYLTWQPRIGRTDAERNCISNIRAEGLPVAAAADKLLWLIRAMRRMRLTGIALKDDQPALPPNHRDLIDASVNNTSLDDASLNDGLGREHDQAQRPSAAR